MDSIFLKDYILKDNYKVLLRIKKGSNAETYRVKGSDGKLYFLKLFDLSKLPRSSFDDSNYILEIKFLKEINHANIVSYVDSGEIIHNERKYVYLILDFIVGETLEERISREHVITLYEVKRIIKEILEGLNYLYNLPEKVIHNEITPKNIMLDLSGTIPVSKIIDFGYARSFYQSSNVYNKEGLDLNYIASECFNNLYSVQSDIFSVGAVMYHLIFGIPPWFNQLTNYKTERVKLEDIIVKERNKPLTFPLVENSIITLSDSTLYTLKKALDRNPDNRFQSAIEFIKALNEEISNDIDEGTNLNLLSEVKTDKTYIQKIEEGFGEIVGMQDLKDKLYRDVIELIEDKEGAALYNISMPNGMLLYGPPGCGKTFFAERFAEEAGFGFKYINPSDLGSIYVHGSQEKIGKLFDEARENAPFIICLDEVSSIFPRRDSSQNHQIGEVDEFLTQLNNCGEDGVFVIALTNFPENIDDAVLRAGRLDIKIYVPPPDFEARKGLFELYLGKIPQDFGMDFEELAKLTENYVSSDIKLIVDEAARELRKTRGRVNMELLKIFIDKTKPSVKKNVLDKFELIKKRFESYEDIDKKPRIGF